MRGGASRGTSQYGRKARPAVRRPATTPDCRLRPILLCTTPALRDVSRTSSASPHEETSDLRAPQPPSYGLPCSGFAIATRVMQIRQNARRPRARRWRPMNAGPRERAAVPRKGRGCRGEQSHVRRAAERKRCRPTDTGERRAMIAAVRTQTIRTTRPPYRVLLSKRSTRSAAHMEVGRAAIGGVCRSGTSRGGSACSRTRSRTTTARRHGDGATTASGRHKTHWVALFFINFTGPSRQLYA